jgi:hypothetical protein
MSREGYQKLLLNFKRTYLRIAYWPASLLTYLRA